jgi:cobalamin biosynthesis protein CobD/CbiB
MVFQTAAKATKKERLAALAPHLSIRLGRPLRYDGRAEKLIGNKEANRRRLVRSLRKSWKL